jgi:hypothetical protein
MKETVSVQPMSKRPRRNSISVDLNIDLENPQLLDTLDLLLRSEMLSPQQISTIAKRCLSEDLPVAPIPVVALERVSKIEPKPIPLAPPSPPVPSLWQTLRDELSVRWLLFLGVFLVVLSSGVLAATQWSRFPAGGQYGLLWLYTIGFWFTGKWAGRGEGLKLTANTLQMAALLLIPVNFWAIDSFGLWQQMGELAIALGASVSLGFMAYLSTPSHQRRKPASRWLMGAYVGLSVLHLGWQIPHWAEISIYVGAIGIALVLQKTREIKRGSLAIYGLGMLLLRGLFVVHLPPTRFSLAIGILGWLFAQWGMQYLQTLERIQSVSLKNPSPRLERHQKTLTGVATLYQRLGAGLLAIGWLLGLGEWQTSPWQSVVVDGLAMIWLWQRLRRSEGQRDLIWLFGIGLQTYFLSSFLWRFLSTGLLLAKILPTVQLWFGPNYPFAAGLLVVPYLLIWVGLTHWFWQKGQPNRCRTGEYLILGTGFIATWITVPSPLALLLSLAIATAILAHLNYRHGTVRSYLTATHLAGLGTITAALAYRWAGCMAIGRSLMTGPVEGVLSGLVFVGLALTLVAAIELIFATRRSTVDSDGWTHSASWVGGTLAILAYGSYAMLLLFPTVHLVWPIWFLLIPAALVYVATRRSIGLPWQLRGRVAAVQWAIGGLAMNVLLSLGNKDWRSIMLLGAVGLMFPLVRWQRCPELVVSPTDDLAVRAASPTGAGSLSVKESLSVPVVVNESTETPENSDSIQPLSATAAAAIHIGFGLGLGVNLLNGWIPDPLWSILGALVCSGLWWISKNLRTRIGVYGAASDYWAFGLAGVSIVLGGGHYFYRNFGWVTGLPASELNAQLALVSTREWLGSILATVLILLGAMTYRHNWRLDNPVIIWFCSTLVTAQIGLGAAVHLLGGNTWSLAIVNVVLAFCLWLGQTLVWNRRRAGTAGESMATVESKLLPGLLATWGLCLRLPFFNSYSGLLSIAIGLMGILLSQRFRFKGSAYGGFVLVTLGCYELVTDRVLQAPPGGNIADALTIFGLVTAVLALGYRLISGLQSRRGQEDCWGLSFAGVKTVAHTHWAAASAWNMAAAVMPVLPLPRFTVLHLLTTGLLGIYALIQGRDRDRGEWWIYLGLAELMGVGVYARSIFRNLGVVDEGLILLACLIGLLLLLAPWSEWGWQDRPWRQVALILPLSRVIFEWDTISLLNLAILATFYGGVARRQQQFGWAYLSLLFVNWAGQRLLVQYQFTSPIWFALLVGLSILIVVQWDPAWRRSRQSRHYGRLAGAGVIAVTALVFHQPWLPIGLGLAIGTAGIIWRTRAWFYVGTITFLLTSSYQLIILITEYPMTKWAIGLLAGVLIIALAANFERRREQIAQVLQHWLDRLQEWQ